MSTGTLGKVNDDVATITTDLDDGNGNGLIPWWAALSSYLTSTYPTDTQLEQFIATGNSVVPGIQGDILLLTTDSAQPPKPDERVK